MATLKYRGLHVEVDVDDEGAIDDVMSKLRKIFCSVRIKQVTVKPVYEEVRPDEGVKKKVADAVEMCLNQHGLFTDAPRGPVFVPPQSISSLVCAVVGSLADVVETYKPICFDKVLVDAVAWERMMTFYRKYRQESDEKS